MSLDNLVDRRYFLGYAGVAIGTVLFSPIDAYGKKAPQKRQLPKKQKPRKTIPGEKEPEWNPATPTESLDARIEAQIGDLRAKGRIANDETVAVYVYDFTKAETLVAIKEDQKMQAASMIKPYVALAYFDQHFKKGWEYADSTRRLMELMLRNSDNPATNKIMRMLGGPEKVQEILQESYAHLLPNTEIVEEIPPGGKTYLNKSTAQDYSRFLYQLYNETLQGSNEMKRLMSLKKRNRLTSFVRHMPPNITAYDKTGTTAFLCGDMGVIRPRGKDGEEFPYTMIVIIEKDNRSNGKPWARERGNVIRELSATVFEHMKGTYRF